MPRISKIIHKPERKRYWIYVDGQYCESVRERTFPALNLTVGQEITCEKIKELEKFHWKHQYGKKAWAKEKVRLDKVCSLVCSISAQLEPVITGFGANTEAFIAKHPEESGKPDIEVRVKGTTKVLIYIEVTGTERMRSTGYWVRPDKLSYARKHQDKDVWIILHYQEPQEEFVFIKPDANKDYQAKKIEIRDSIEYYAIFNNQMTECVPFERFRDNLLNKL